jgi:hypothetical protein
MALSDVIPRLSDKDLVNLRDNAERLVLSGVAKQQRDATEALPLINAEIATRKANAPPPVKRAPTRKKKVVVEADPDEADPEPEAED